MSPAKAIDTGRCVSRTSGPSGPGRMSTTVAAGRGSTCSTASPDTLAGAATGVRIEWLHLDDVARRRRRRATERHPDREERRYLELLFGRDQVAIAEADHEDRPLADQRFDPALAGDPAVVDDVRVVDDEDVGTHPEHLLAVPERCRRVPLRQDRGVLRQHREYRVDVLGSGQVAASIGGAPVRQSEKKGEDEDDTADGDADPADRDADAGLAGLAGSRDPRHRQASRQSIGDRVERDRRPDADDQPRDEQVVLELEVVGPDIEPQDEDRDAHQPECRPPPEEYHQSAEAKNRQDWRRPADEEVPERRQRVDETAGPG